MVVKDKQKDDEQQKLASELEKFRKWAKKFEALYNEYEQAIRTLRSFEKALETMQIGVTITDLKGDIIYINSADLEMHGHAGENLMGKNIRIFAPSDTWKFLDDEQIKKMKRWKRESVNKRKDGSIFPVQLMSDLVTDEEGNPIGIVTTCEDISERKKMEKEIIKKVKELEKFYEMSVGREVRMKELKKEIERLKEQNKKDNIDS